MVFLSVYCNDRARRAVNQNQISMRLPVDWEESSAGGSGGWKKAHVEAKTPDSGSGCSSGRCERKAVRQSQSAATKASRRRDGGSLDGLKRTMVKVEMSLVASVLEPVRARSSSRRLMSVAAWRSVALARGVKCALREARTNSTLGGSFGGMESMMPEMFSPERMGVGSAAKNERSASPTS